MEKYRKTWCPTRTRTPKSGYLKVSITLRKRQEINIRPFHEPSEIHKLMQSMGNVERISTASSKIFA